MKGKEQQKIALFSVNDLEDMVEFARALVAKGWGIVATPLAYNLLKEAQIPATSVAAFVGQTEEYSFPATLHPKIEAALTMDGFAQRIELVYDITYGPQDGLDVGGNALLALAVKGRRIPVSSRRAMRAVVDAISNSGDIPAQMRQDLISATARKIADYYVYIAESLAEKKLKYLKTEWSYGLANGENPYQTAAFWSLDGGDGLALTKYRLISDNLPCYTNLADLDSITDALAKLRSAFRLRYNKEPYITIAAKHGNACGIGVDWESTEASIEKALWGNPIAIWGGEVIVNFKLGAKEAQALAASQRRKKELANADWMLDIVAAPCVNDEAAALLTKRKNAKVFINPALPSPPAPAQGYSYRFVRGGVIRQSAADYILDIPKLDWNIPGVSPEGIDDILIAWAAAFASFHGGNEVALSRNRQLFSCAGGPSTVCAAETAVARAVKLHGSLQGAAFAADAFFPFSDAPLILSGCGAVCGVVPAGGRRQNEIREFFSEKNIRVGFIPAEFRGFCRH